MRVLGSENQTVFHEVFDNLLLPAGYMEVLSGL